MKKFATIMVAGLIFITGAACGGGSSATTPEVEAPATTTTTPEVEAPATTTTNNSAKKATLCVEIMETVNDGIQTITDGLQSITSVDSATAHEFLATAGEFVSTSIESVQLCAELAPAEAAITLDWLNKFQDSLTDLDDLI